jgi:hydrogenase maturation factor HypF (carbamoyltransferase family)
MIFSGDDLGKMLNRTMETKISCRKCSATFTFEDGANYAVENGIIDKVVMCPKCHSVYEVTVM